MVAFITVIKYNQFAVSLLGEFDNRVSLDNKRVDFGHNRATLALSTIVIYHFVAFR